MGDFTPNYGLAKPTADDAMSNFETWLNANWDLITDAASPPSGTTLPQSGSYKIGDRFYKSDTKSIYILVVKDANWGWHWRPIHDAISPWFTVPTTCLNIANWVLNPVAANPFAIAFDNRGKCYWRGVIAGPSGGNIVRYTSWAVFKALPEGLRPRQKGVYMLGHETLSVGTDATNIAAWQGARIFLPEDSVTTCSIRTFGGTADFSRVYLTGVHYPVATSKYTVP